ncbi:hypothetical protein [Alteriqipengyuania sp. 357]
MPYRPQFDRGHLCPPLAALIPAAGYAAIFVSLSIAPFILAEPLVGPEARKGPGPEPMPDLVRGAIMLVVMLLGLATAAFVTIAVAFLLLGVPVAWIIGRRMQHPASYIPALLLWCACGSALIYRHFVIRFRNENDLLD